MVKSPNTTSIFPSWFIMLYYMVHHVFSIVHHLFIMFHVFSIISHPLSVLFNHSRITFSRFNPCCLVVSNMAFIFHFVYGIIMDNHPNWLSYFSRWLKPPTSLFLEPPMACQVTCPATRSSSPPPAERTTRCCCAARAECWQWVMMATASARCGVLWGSSIIKIGIW